MLGYNFIRRNLMISNRLSHLLTSMKQQHLDAVAINPGPSLIYLTGLHFHLMERPTVLLVKSDQTCALILPELEMLKVKDSPLPIKTFPFGDNPQTWKDAFHQASRFLDLDKKKVGVEPLHLRIMEFDFLKEAAPTAEFIDGSAVFTDLRICKDAQEAAATRKAVKIAQDALKATLPFIKAGRTEKQIAAELTLQLLRAGSDSEFPFEPIVSSGPNSANPHAVPSERVLQRGDLLVIDYGAIYDGYISDLTRTFAIGEVEPEFSKIADLVLQANTAGRQRATSGIHAGDVDKAARGVIEKAGYGTYFNHRTGHGIGMEAHEPPYIFGENELVLQPGMCFTVEPGIYLPNRGGVRIEDNILITEGGAETLSDLPRELITIE
jgi:Xaa-Pro dipeptidase